MFRIVALYSQSIKHQEFDVVGIVAFGPQSAHVRVGSCCGELCVSLVGPDLGQSRRVSL